MGDIADYVNGRAFRTSEWETAGRPIIRIQNLTKSSSRVHYYSREVEEMYIVRPGDILVSWAATVDVFVWSGPEAVLNQHIFKVLPFVDEKFAFYAIKSILRRLREQVHGTGMQHITRGLFLSTPIPVPPRGEQTRIAEKIERLRENLSQARLVLGSVISAVAAFRKSLLATAFRGGLTRPNLEDGPASVLIDRIQKDKIQALVSKPSRRPSFPPGKQLYRGEGKRTAPYAIPDHWVWATADQVSIASEGGSTPLRTDHSNFDPEGVPLIKVENIHDDGKVVLVKNQLRIEREIHDGRQRKSRVRPGDVLVNIVGPPLGKIGLIPSEIPEANINQAIVFFRPHPLIFPEYLWWALRSPVINAILKSMGKGVRQENIRRTQVGKIAVPLAPKAEQYEIVCKLQGLFDRQSVIVAEARDALGLLDVLDEAVLARGLRGELVEQDPGEEPASALLDDIDLRRRQGYYSSRPRDQTSDRKSRPPDHPDRPNVPSTKQTVLVSEYSEVPRKASHE